MVQASLATTDNRFSLPSAYAIALLITVCAVYSGGIQGPFLFDDFPNISNNHWLKPASATMMDWRSAALSSDAGALRRPLPMLSFAAQSIFGGDADPAPFKLVNLLIHLACTVLLYQLVKCLMMAPCWEISDRERHWMPLIAAAIWALNPLHVSTVLYSVQRMAQMSALFVLAGLWVYARYRQRWVLEAPKLDEFLACIAWLLLIFLAGIYSKENAVLMPVLILTVELFFFRGFLAGRQLGGLALLTWIAFLAPLVIVATAGIYFREWILAGYATRDFTLTERVLTEARVLWSHVHWFTIPNPAALGMFHDDIPISQGLFSPVTGFVSLIAWSLACIFGLVAIKRWPVLGFGVFFYLLGHSLESTVLALELVFEHRNYLPTVGLAILLAAAFLRAGQMLEARQVSRTLATLPVLALMLGLAVSTLSRASSWSSDLSLASSAFQHHPQSARSAYYYINSLLNERQQNTDQQMVREALALARHELEVLYRRDESDIPALTHLYLVDTQLFPDIGQAPLWLSSLEEAIDRGELSASDFAALASLKECALSHACELSVAQLDELLALFEERFWIPAAVRRQRLSLARAALDSTADAEFSVAPRLESGAESYAQRVEAALAANPGDPEIHYMMMEAYLRSGDYPGAHRTAIGLMRADQAKRQLPILRDLFAPRPPR
ncbi:MAG: hypothetical protein Cons2KO_23710 [Congregibacter sp.]